MDNEIKQAEAEVTAQYVPSVLDVQQKMYEPTQGVTMVSIFSSFAPVEKVMYFLAENNIPFRVVLGSYQGAIETSFAIPTILFPQVLAAGWILDGQVCVMHTRTIQSSKESIVHFEYMQNQDVSSRFVYMGNMHIVPKNVALAEEGYTFDPVSMLYSIIRK